MSIEWRLFRPLRLEGAGKKNCECQFLIPRFRLDTSTAVRFLAISYKCAMAVRDIATKRRRTIILLRIFDALESQTDR